MVHNHEKCSAPICPSDPNYKNNTWSWFPDEPICNGSPKTHIQKIQMRIQKLFKRGKIANTRFFTSDILEKIERVVEGIKGKNPDERKSHTMPL